MCDQLGQDGNGRRAETKRYGVTAGPIALCHSVGGGERGWGWERHF